MKETWTMRFMGKYRNGLGVDNSLQYANLFDENGNDAGTLSANAETYEDGNEIKWTGNIETCFKASGSDEFDVIDVDTADIKPSQKAVNAKKAKRCIQRCFSDAKELEISSR